MNLSTHDSNYVIENNIIHDLTCSGVGGDSSHGIALGALRSVTVRNNLIYGIPGTGIVAWTRDSGLTRNNQRVRIYNNTVYGAGGGIALSDFDDAPMLRNNLIFGSSTPIDGPTVIDSDYNLLAPIGSAVPEGSHSIVQVATSGIVVDAAGSNFHLVAGSPAIDRGVDLSQSAVSGFSVDLEGITRPQGPNWDIGAYELR
jgi:parallel beta-helix repeat protein